jgi:hypothetical protein
MVQEGNEGASHIAARAGGDFGGHLALQRGHLVDGDSVKAWVHR